VMRFRDRDSAGVALAAALKGRLSPEAVVLGLPRGGVVVAAAVGRTLDLPVDVLVSRKLGAPMQPELGIGAVAEGDALWLNHRLTAQLGLDEEAIAALVSRESREVARRAERYRQGRPPALVEGRTVVLVDDGIATGGTVMAALRALRPRHPARIVLAVPVAAAETLELLRPEVDDLVVLHIPEVFGGVGAWFEAFRQLDDREVLASLGREDVGSHERSTSGGFEQLTTVHAAGARLPGTLTVPDGAKGIVLFAHGSGSSRHSVRNRAVASVLHRAGLATLLFDLLTSAEETEDLQTCAFRFDIGLLAERLVGAVDWCHRRYDVGALPVGLFGASTGAAAALVAAARRPDRIRAVVSRGGRPDLAGAELDDVRAPTLLVVGEADETVLALNQQVFEKLVGSKRLTVVPGATHLFEEPGALDDVARLAAAWFVERLAPDRGEAAGAPAGG